jgi:hypothetical protein
MEGLGLETLFLDFLANVSLFAASVGSAGSGPCGP